MHIRPRMMLLLTLSSAGVWAQGRDVPVPAACTPAVNAKLQEMARAHRRRYTENVMACGTALGTRVNYGGRHGAHHIITVRVNLPEDGIQLIQVVINDSMDGAVSARPNDLVFALGQGYVTSGRWIAGIHDVHCSTHPGADNGWVVINGNKTPKTCGY